MGQGIVYRHAVEALIEKVVLKHRLLTSRELRDLGVEPPRDCPMETFVRLLSECGKRLDPENPLLGLERLGREMIIAYGEGLVGRGLFMVLRLLGPQRSLLRMAQNMSTADDCTEVKSREVAPRHVRLTFNHSYGLERYQVGLLSQLLKTVGVNNSAVQVEPGAGDEVTYVVTW